MIETRPKKTHERASNWSRETRAFEMGPAGFARRIGELLIPPAPKSLIPSTQKLQKPTAPYYIGKGKAEQSRHSFKDREVTSVIVRRRTFARAGPQFGKTTRAKVLDRTQLILDIFAQRAAQSRRPIADRAGHNCNNLRRD